MKNKKKYGNIIFILVLSFLVFLIGCDDENARKKSGQEKSEEEYTIKDASLMPYGKYPEQITYTLGKLTADSDVNMPEGDTYENNAYTRYIKEILNVQNKNIFEASGNHYDNMVSMAVANDEMPDIMLVQDQEVLKDLVEQDLIEDLTQSFETCASDRIKDIYNSYDGKVLERGTFDGKLMAIPETNIESTPSFLWLRKDWMEELGLKDPKTLEDAVEIVRQFVEKDPGNNGQGETTGLLFDSDGMGNGDKCYQMDIIFSTFGAYPQKWIRDEDGNVVYGSITKEAKEALRYLQALYQENILDPYFLMRSIVNLDKLIADEKCGSFFGLWWAPNNPLMSALNKNPKARWQPYLIATEDNGMGITAYSPSPTNKYIVVRKGYEHPEIAVKIINVMFDYTRYIDRDNKEMQEYFALNVNPTARPLAINVDYKQALTITTENIKATLKGEKEREDLVTIEKSYYDICKSYLEHQENPTPEEWAAYVSRISTMELLSNAKVSYLDNLFEGTTKTMKTEGWNLKRLEKDAYLRIISGDADIDYFDIFVKDWKEQGGVAITREIAREINK